MKPAAARTARFAAFAAAAAALSAVPVLWARASAPAGASFLWVLPPYADDALAYAAWVRQAALGCWLFTVKFTAAPQPAVIVQPLFLLAGWLCRAAAVEPGLALTVLRVLGVAPFLFALDRFLRRFPLSPRARVLAFAFATVSSGFGWIAAAGILRPSSVFPADLWLMDIGTAWSLVWNPLAPWALALMLEILSVWLDERAAGRTRRVLIAGALASLLAFVHPYDAAIVLAASAAAVAIRRKGVRELAVFAAAAAPGALYQLWASSANPVLSAHAELGFMASPTPLGLAWGLGVPGLLALAGSVRVKRSGQAAAYAPALGWAGAALLAAYAPVWFQRKLLFGVQLPLAVLAAVAADAALERLPRARAVAAAVLLVALTLPTHAFNALRAAASLRATGDRGPFFIGLELKAALDALAARARPEEAVLAAPDLSLLIPGATGNVVIGGHWAQSGGMEAARAKTDEALAPASGLSPPARLAALREQRVSLILFDDSLKALAGGSIPPWLSAASEPVFSSPRYELVRLAGGASRR